jgi:hypothetical protein
MRHPPLAVLPRHHHTGALTFARTFTLVDARAADFTIRLFLVG